MSVPFKRYEEFWDYCMNACPVRLHIPPIGCAANCEYRRLLRIPPHSKRYDDKFYGPIKEVCTSPC